VILPIISTPSSNTKRNHSFRSGIMQGHGSRLHLRTGRPCVVDQQDRLTIYPIDMSIGDHEPIMPDRSLGRSGKSRTRGEQQAIVVPVVTAHLARQFGYRMTWPWSIA
jgi:hypothetical protein